MFSSLSEVRSVFWTSPYLNIVCISLEKPQPNTNVEILIGPSIWCTELNKTANHVWTKTDDTIIRNVLNNCWKSLFINILLKSINYLLTQWPAINMKKENMAYHGVSWRLRWVSPAQRLALSAMCLDDAGFRTRDEYILGISMGPVSPMGFPWKWESPS